MVIFSVAAPGRAASPGGTAGRPAEEPAKLSDQGAVFPARTATPEYASRSPDRFNCRRRPAVLRQWSRPKCEKRRRSIRWPSAVSFEAKREPRRGRSPRPRTSRFACDSLLDGGRRLAERIGRVRGSGGPRQAAKVELRCRPRRLPDEPCGAAERFIALPKDPSPRARSFRRLAGKVSDYDAVPRRARACDADLRPESEHESERLPSWGQNSFKIGMMPRIGAVEYRLHFWKRNCAAARRRQRKPAAGWGQF